MESSASEFPDWTDLPFAVVHLILENLKSIVDYVRFRAVCSPWRSASLPKPHHLPPQLPWLMLPYDPNQKDDDGIRLFYDLWESKTRKLHLPETIGMLCCASYSGWLLLVTIGGSKVFLLNPLTRARVNLPPFTVIITRIWKHVDYAHVEIDRFYSSSMNGFTIIKLTFSSDLTDPNCLVMVFSEYCDEQLLFCRVKDNRWTCYETVDAEGGPRCLIDAAYHNGNFYLLLEDDEAFEIFNLRQHMVEVVDFLIPELGDALRYFLVKKSGLCLVSVNYDEEEEEEELEFMEWDHKQIVEMYQISEDMMKVQHITDTSGTIIFHGDNHHYLAVSADDWDSLDGGCMYMSNNSEYYSIFSAKLNDYKCQPVVIGIDGCPPVLLDSPAMWFQPSLF